MNAIPKPKWYIQSFRKNTNQLMDISEQGYNSLTECQTKIDAEIRENEEIAQQVLAQYEEDLKNFVMDNDCSDRPPVRPRISSLQYTMVPHQYIQIRGAYLELTDLVIPNMDSLQVSQEQLLNVNFILNGTVDPEIYPSVKAWISQCHNKPNADELKMCAINEILEGYGIKSVRTSKWKNGYWCDILCTYVNMGDSYIPTVIHHRKHGFTVASIGDVIEKNKHVI